MKTFLQTHKNWLFPVFAIGLFLMMTYVLVDTIYPERYSDESRTETVREFTNPIQIIFLGTIEREEDSYSTYPFNYRLLITWNVLYYLMVVICGIGYFTKIDQSKQWLKFLLLLNLWLSIFIILSPVFYHIIEVFATYNGPSFARTWNPWISTFGYVLKNLPMPLVLIGVLWYLYDEDESATNEQSENTLLVPMHWLRFINYHFDRFVILLFCSSLLVAAYTNFHYLSLFENPQVVKLIAQVSFGVSLILAYFICESIFRRTPGKILTRTVIVGQERELSTLSVLKRTLSRLIPFNAFSFLGSKGWHDSISKTSVALTAERGSVKRIGTILNVVLISFLTCTLWMIISFLLLEGPLGRGGFREEEIYTFAGGLTGLFWILSFLLFATWMSYVTHYLENIVYEKQSKLSHMYAYPYLFLFIPFVNVFIMTSLLTKMDQLNFKLRKKFGEKGKYYFSNMVVLTGILFFIVQLLFIWAGYDIFSGGRAGKIKLYISLGFLSLLVAPMFMYIRYKVMLYVNPWIEKYETDGFEVEEDNPTTTSI